jgi:hypothetical protein
LQLWDHLFAAAPSVKSPPDPPARDVLEAVRRRRLAELHGVEDRDPTEEDERLALEMLGLTQAEYARQEPYGYLPNAAPPAAFMFQQLAVAVLKRRHGGNGRPAKEAQIRIANGRPLAVCVGTLTHESVQVDGGWTFTSHRDGCGRIFEDTTRLNGRPWATKCRICRRKRSQRRRAARAAARRIATR